MGKHVRTVERDDDAVSTYVPRHALPAQDTSFVRDASPMCGARPVRDASPMCGARPVRDANPMCGESPARDACRARGANPERDANPGRDASRARSPRHARHAYSPPEPCPAQDTQTPQRRPSAQEMRAPQKAALTHEMNPPQKAALTHDARGPQEDAQAEPSSNSTSSNASVARSTALMSIATLGSRATGLIRTWAMAFVLGNGFLTSSYQLANNMPNTIYELVVGGILGAAFIPLFLLQKEQQGDKGANDFACNVLNLFLILLSLLTLVAVVFAPQVIWTQTFAEGSSQDVIDHAVRFFRIFAIQILFYGIGGVITGMLNAQRVYFLPSLAPALNNIVVIASFFAYIPLSHIDADLALNMLALGTSLGVVVQFAIQIPALIKSGFRYRWFIDLHDPALIEAVKIALPTFLYIAGTMVSFSCRNAFSLQAADNGPSTLLYAWTWYQLPHGVLAVSLSRALFTEMSDDAAKGNHDSLRRHVESGVAGTLLIMIPLACLMGALSTPLMQLFRAGAFSADDVYTVSRVLALWAISLPVYSASMFVYNVFASVRKFHVFAAISSALVIVQVALYALLCNPQQAGLYGVPIADLVYYGALFIIAIIIAGRYTGRIKIGRALGLSARALAAGLIGAAAALLLQSLLPPLGDGMLSGLVSLCVCGLVGLVVSFGLCVVFRIPEMSMITGIVKRFLPQR